MGGKIKLRWLCIFCVWSFEIKKDILRNQKISVRSFEIDEIVLRNQKIIIGYDSFSNQRLNIFGPFWILPVFVSTTLLMLIDAKFQLFYLAQCCQIYRSLKRLK